MPAQNLLPPYTDGELRTIGSKTWKRYNSLNAWLRIGASIDVANMTDAEIDTLLGRIPDATLANRGIMTKEQVAKLEYLLGAVGALFVATPAGGALAAGTLSQLYGVNISVSGGQTPITYALQAGTLPAGITLDPATGALTGIPTGPVGLSTFTIRATDNQGAYKDITYSITVAAPSLTLTPSSLADPQATLPYAVDIDAAGGTAPYTFAVIAGALPAGLTLNAATGSLSGTPSATLGTFGFTIRATDSAGQTGQRAYAFSVVQPPVTLTGTLGNGSTASVYNQDINATGGTGHTFAVTAGALPSGVTLNAATGGLTGTPASSGTFTFTVTATSAEGFIGTQAYSIDITNIAPPTIVVAPAGPALAAGIATRPYTTTISASGGTAPYTYAVSAGTLPAGVTLNTSTGVLSGTPSAAATSSFTIQATDAGGYSGTRAYTLTVAAAPTITLTAISTATFNVGAAVSGMSAAASGGTAPYTYAVTAGALPAGLTLNASTGAITGTPTAAATSSFTVRATDANGFQGSRSYSVTTGYGVGAVVTSGGWDVSFYLSGLIGKTVGVTTVGAQLSLYYSMPNGLSTAVVNRTWTPPAVPGVAPGQTWKLLSVSPTTNTSAATASIQRMS